MLLNQELGCWSCQCLSCLWPGRGTLSVYIAAIKPGCQVFGWYRDSANGLKTISVHALQQRGSSEPNRNLKQLFPFCSQSEATMPAGSSCRPALCSQEGSVSQQAPAVSVHPGFVSQQAPAVTVQGCPGFCPDHRSSFHPLP